MLLFVVLLLLLLAVVSQFTGGVAPSLSFALSAGDPNVLALVVCSVRHRYRYCRDCYRCGRGNHWVEGVDSAENVEVVA